MNRLPYGLVAAVSIALARVNTRCKGRAFPPSDRPGGHRMCIIGEHHRNVCDDVRPKRPPYKESRSTVFAIMSDQLGAREQPISVRIR